VLSRRGVDLREGEEGKRPKGESVEAGNEKNLIFWGRHERTGIPCLRARPCLLFLARLVDAKWGAELWYSQLVLPGSAKRIQVFSYSVHRSRLRPNQRPNMKIASIEDRTDEPRSEPILGPVRFWTE